MIDDDVICLSSDDEEDESTLEKPPRKKCKTSDVTSTEAKTEPMHDDRDADDVVICDPKETKSSRTVNASDGVLDASDDIVDALDGIAGLKVTRIENSVSIVGNDAGKISSELARIDGAIPTTTATTTVESSRKSENSNKNIMQGDRSLKINGSDDVPKNSKTPERESPNGSRSKFVNKLETPKDKNVHSRPDINKSTNPSIVNIVDEDTNRCSKIVASSSTDTIDAERNSSEKPQLIVRNKKPVYPVDQDTFAMFLSLCLQTERNAEMEKIVTKLKRNYDSMDQKYARSHEFADFLNLYRDKIEKKKRHVYIYISAVLDEMKTRKIKKNVKNATRTDEKIDRAEETKSTNAGEPVAGTSDGLVAAAADDDDDDDEDPERARKRAKIKRIEHSMKMCEKRIKKLEEAEVDFDEENNSNFIKLERYKEQVVKLYRKLCEYTGEEADAGRAYLRPKHLKVTQINEVDQAINSFINTNLSNNRKIASKGKTFADLVVFPDFVDILECIDKCNDQRSLGMDKRARQTLAETAFTQLGEYLQKARMSDYWDTFSVHLENADDDPATKDRELAEKLTKRQEEGKKKLNAVFEEYVKKQNEVKSTETSNESSNTDEEKGDTDQDSDSEPEASNDKEDVEDDASLESLHDDLDDDNDVNDVNEVNDEQDDNELRDEQTTVNVDTSDATTITIENNNEIVIIETIGVDEPDRLDSQGEKKKTEADVGDRESNDKANATTTKTTAANNEETAVQQGRPNFLRIRSFAKSPVSWRASDEDLGSESNHEKFKSNPEVAIVKPVNVLNETGMKRKIERLTTAVVGIRSSDRNVRSPAVENTGEKAEFRAIRNNGIGGGCRILGRSNVSTNSKVLRARNDLSMNRNDIVVRSATTITIRSKSPTNSGNVMVTAVVPARPRPPVLQPRATPSTSNGPHWTSERDRPSYDLLNRDGTIFAPGTIRHGKPYEQWYSERETTGATATQPMRHARVSDLPRALIRKLAGSGRPAATTSSSTQRNSRMPDRKVEDNSTVARHAARQREITIAPCSSRDSPSTRPGLLHDPDTRPRCNKSTTQSLLGSYFTKSTQSIRRQSHQNAPRTEKRSEQLNRSGSPSRSSGPSSKRPKTERSERL